MNSNAWTSQLLHKIAVFVCFFACGLLADLPQRRLDVGKMRFTETVGLPKNGTQVKAPLQLLQATVFSDGLRLWSTESGKAGEISLRTIAIGRDGTETVVGPGHLSRGSGNLILLDHGLLMEEFSAGNEGIRQDFIIKKKPHGHGELFLRIGTRGAHILNRTDGNLGLTLSNGRELVYHKLQVMDASGVRLTARMSKHGANEIHIRIDDEGAIYPITIDPTVSDADWVSMNNLMVGADEAINAVLVVGSDLYVGGSFSKIGNVQARSIAKWNGTTWSALGSGMSSSVYSLVEKNGILYAGGSFDSAGGIHVNRIAKWNGTTWSALGSGVAGVESWDQPTISIYSLAIHSNGDLYVGGIFDSAGGIATGRIAKWNGTIWESLGAGVNRNSLYDGRDNGVFSIVMKSNGEVYAGGLFDSAGGVHVNNIAKWDGATWSALAGGIDEIPDYGEHPDQGVNALALDASENLIVAGSFYSAGGVSANKIVKWDGAKWSPLGTGISGRINDLVFDDTWNLYVSGVIDSAGGIPVKNIAKWDGSTWFPVGTGIKCAGEGANRLTNAMNNCLYLGCNGRYGILGSDLIAKWNGDIWSSVPSSGSGPNFAVNALVNGRSNSIYVGGDFTNVGGLAANHVAKWKDGNWSALGSGLNGFVEALLIDRLGSLYAAGSFTMAGGVTANRVAKWDGSTWSALGSGLNDDVLTMAMDSSGRLYVGGKFTTAGGASAKRVAMWDGNAWSPLGAGMDSTVNALVVGKSGKLYAGGRFSKINGILMSKVVEWNGNTWISLGTGRGFGYVNALVADTSGNIYAGGYISTSLGSTADQIVKWNGSTWSKIAGPNGVYAMALDSYGNLYISSSDSMRISRYGDSQWYTLGFGSKGHIPAILPWGSDSLIIGGDFLSAGGKHSPYIAKVRTRFPQTLTFNLGENDSILYGTPPFTPLAISNSGLTNFRYTSHATSVAVIVSGSIHPYRIGSAVIEATQPGNFMYKEARAKDTLSVFPAVLTIQAHDTSRKIGAENPLFKWDVTGLVRGDDISVLSGVTISTTAVATSPAGTYPIVVSGGSAENYRINYVTGELTVTKESAVIPRNKLNVTVFTKTTLVSVFDLSGRIIWFQEYAPGELFDPREVDRLLGSKYWTSKQIKLSQ